MLNHQRHVSVCLDFCSKNLERAITILLNIGSSYLKYSFDFHFGFCLPKKESNGFSVVLLLHVPNPTRERNREPVVFGHSLVGKHVIQPESVGYKSKADHGTQVLSLSRGVKSCHLVLLMSSWWLLGAGCGLERMGPKH